MHSIKFFNNDPFRKHKRRRKRGHSSSGNKRSDNNYKKNLSVNEKGETCLYSIQSCLDYLNEPESWSSDMDVPR